MKAVQCCNKCQKLEVGNTVPGDRYTCKECWNREIEDAHEAGEDCGQEKCQECCAHDERDHGICLDCEHEEDPGAAIDRAMDAMEDR